jgi:hypothetical protein
MSVGRSRGIVSVRVGVSLAATWVRGRHRLAAVPML